MVKSAQIDIHHSTGLEDAKARLTATRSCVLLTDVVFERGTWRDALQMTALLPRTALVVVSRLLDERLWIGALERGAYDMILKPFQADELRRVLENACFHSASEMTDCYSQ
jgi:DNA-binding NtrC family response regulator